jgi:hypothetical protein
MMIFNDMYSAAAVVVVVVRFTDPQTDVVATSNQQGRDKGSEDTMEDGSQRVVWFAVVSSSELGKK